MGIDEADLTKTLVEEWDYEASQVGSVVNKLLAMDGSLLVAFETWFHTGILPQEPTIHGFTPKLIGENYPFKPPAIFLLLDWLKREPQEALQALAEEYSVTLRSMKKVDSLSA